MWIKEEDKVNWTSSLCLMMLTISLFGIENSKCSVEFKNSDGRRVDSVVYKNVKIKD